MRGMQALKGTGLQAAQLLPAALCLLLSTGALAFTTGYTITSSTSVHFYVTDSSWTDLHYQVNGGGQLNYRMIHSGTGDTYDVTGLPAGATVRYFFTVGTGSTATDTAWASFTLANGGGGGGGTTNPGTGNWAVVWEDTFDTAGQPNPANWSYHVGNGFNPGAGAFSGWGNGEWEWYRPENTYVQNGNLVIKAEYLDSPFTVSGRQWYQRSGRITTKGKKTWTYGRVEARIAMPNAIGTWPAFWMMGAACDDTVTTSSAPALSSYDTMASNWSSCGEIDIMEHKNSETVTYQNAFWDNRTGLYPWADGQNNNLPHNNYAGDVSQFHLYTIEWEPTQIRYYIDRDTNTTPVHTIDISAANQEEFKKPFHIILTGSWVGHNITVADKSIIIP